MTLVRLSAAVVIALTTSVAAQPASDLTREFQEGVDAFRLGKFDEAKAHLERAKSLDPKLPGPHRFLAAVAQAQGRWEDCIASARIAIELNPRSGEIGDTRKVHDECRLAAGRTPYRDDLGESAAIAVVTSVAGATVKIGGLNYGGTPLAPRPITAGPLEIDVAKAGWKPVHVSINALPGIVTDVIIELDPDPNAVNPDIEVKHPTSATLGYLVVKGDAPVISVAGQIYKPVNGRFEVPPGTHVIEVERAQHDPWRRRVRITAGQSIPVEPVFVATAPRESKEKLGIALVAGGAAVAVFGFVAQLKSTSAAADAREINRLETARPPKGEFTRADFDAAHDRAKKWSLISNITYATALVAFGTGAVFLYLGGRERSDVPPPFAITPVAGGAVVSRGTSW
ncbi:hypothetical protein BH11MYX3_BH11MYX3_35660 [soil metagenome]